MYLNNLEKKILECYFIENKIKSINFDNISISKRTYTGNGFFTFINNDSKLKVSHEEKSYKWGKLGAKINNNCDVGFLIYIDNGYITTIEGYTYDIEWPNNIIDVEFYKIDSVQK